MPLTPPRAFKPDLDEAARRWQAYLAGSILDRPVVCVTAPRAGAKSVPGVNYRDRVFGQPEEVIGRMLEGAAATYYGGEAIPSFWMSFGPDEIAVFCGSEFKWSDDSGNTNWSVPFVEDWEQALPLRFNPQHPLWQRMLALYRLGAERCAGKLAMAPLDLHSNMDILAAIRGPQRLCMDLLDQPAMVDRAMSSARAVFPIVWSALREAGRMNELTCCNGVYSPEGAAVLQCDFSCMISPALFDRWVLPALEEEAALVRHAYYHWDGPGAQVHTRSLCASRGLHTLSYVAGDGHGSHIGFLELFKRVQSLGKAMHFWGTPDECKAAHRELRPEKVMYSTGVQTEKEADELLKWFVKNT